MSKIDIGSRVAYSARWLRSTGNMTGPLGFARGKVRELIPLGEKVLAKVEWDIDGVPEKVLTDNLALVGPNRDFCWSD